MLHVRIHRSLVLIALALSVAWAGEAIAVSSPEAVVRKLLTGSFIHEDWRSQHGLPGHSVRALLQTRDGYLVLGTDQGLAHFDGTKFTQIILGPAGGGSGPLQVRSLLEDAAGDLWVGTQRGLLRRHGGVFKRYTIADGLPDDLVGPIYQDRRGRLWVSTDGGLAQQQGERFVRVEGSREIFFGMTEDSHGGLWAVNQRVFLLRDGTLASYSLDLSDPRIEARAIQQDERGRIYVATLDSLLRYDPPSLPGLGPPTRRYTRADGLPDRPITQLFLDPEGRLWIGTSGAGLLLLSGDQFSHLTAQEGLPDDMVWAIGSDREGGIAVGTGGGLSLFMTRSMLTHDETPSVWSICGDRDGLWLGTQQGLLRFDHDIRVSMERPAPIAG